MSFGRARRRGFFNNPCAARWRWRASLSDDAKKRLEEGEKIAQGLRLNGTPQTLVYQISDRKPVGAIAGANYKEFEVYLKTKEEKK